MMNLPTIYKLNIRTKEDLLECISLWKAHQPKDLIAFDEESNGLNIKRSIPFLHIFGFLSKTNEVIYTFTIDFEKSNRQLIVDTMYTFNKFCEYAKLIIGHNVVFDLHMLTNVNFPVNHFDKITDTSFYIRLAHDAKQQEHGGPPLGLKDYASRYIDKHANIYEKRLKREQTIIKKKNNMELKRRLREFPLPQRFKHIAKSWTMGVIEDFFKDKLNEIDDLDPEIAKIIHEWQANSLDPEDYSVLDREIVTEYAHYDVFYTICIYLYLKDKVVEREQTDVLDEEQRAIEGFYELERTGTVFDMEKALEAKENTKTYILKLRTELTDLLGESITVNQGEKLKEILLYKFKVNLPDTTKDTLKYMRDKNLPKEVDRILQIVSELRSLEKWYSLYLLHWIEEAEKFGNRIYPTYFQVGAVTGRVSSPFQQFPKKAKYTIDEEYLFHPRELFRAPEGYDIFFFDYAAMEMRIQAIYTILIKHPDLNLLRAFVPYDCYRYDATHNATLFSFKDKDWEQYKWYKKENNELWVETDIHTSTTKRALGISEDHAEFPYWRGIGKRINFSIIYGAMPKKIKEAQRLTIKQATDFYNAFFEEFPKLRNYEAYVQNFLDRRGYVQNLFGRKYYGISTHEGKNYLIQGSGADYTKRLIPLLTELLRDKKSRMQGYLHDEFSFIIPPEERYLVKEIKRIMESAKTPILMKVDVEISTTNWKEKKDYDISVL